MKRLLLASWARPSLLAAILLPTLAIASAGRSTLGSVGTLADPYPADGGTSAATLAALPIAAAGASDLDLPLGAQRYLHGIPYGELIESAAERHGLDPLLVAAVAEAESNFRVDAVSPKGALGLMQLMPIHVDDGVEPFDPAANLELGAALLAELTSRFDGDLELALAAYHAGPGAVDRFRGMPPYRSTERYVERVLEIYLEHYSQIVGEG
jgi:soluble lytic murein transglycosylase-like protein